MINKVKTAVVGCGMISSVYLRNLRDLFSITELVAVCDVNPEKAKQQAEKYGVPQVMTVEEIAASEDVELVVVLTGPMYSFSVIRTMLEAGKHVFTEKTISCDLAHAGELVRLANEKGVLLGAAPDTVLGAGVQTAKKVLESGLIGTVTSALVSINRNHNLNAEEFRFIQSSAISSFPYDVGIYYMAAVLCLLGPVKTVCGFVEAAPLHPAEHLFHNPQKEEFRLPGPAVMTGAMRMCSGAEVSIHFNGSSVNEEQDVLWLYGTEGILKVTGCGGFDGEVTLIRAETGSCVIPHTHGYDGKPVLPDLDPRLEAGYGHRGLGAAELAWAVRAGRPAARCSKEFAFHTMEALVGLEQSAKEQAYFQMTSTFTMAPLKSGYLSTMFHGFLRGDAERSIME